jgi:hypothetical protein
VRSKANLFALIAFQLALLIMFGTAPASISKENHLPHQSAETRYLLFQIFTYSPGGSGRALFPQQGLYAATVSDIITRVGVKGDRKNKLGFCLGPLTLSQSDDDTRCLIREGFDLAKRDDVAVAFHIDDQMFWDGRTELATKDNIEWTDWNGTLATARRLDWGETPSRVAPPLCLNSPAVQAAVSRRARVIGNEIKKEVDALKTAGKEYLFAGVIAGWESMIGKDFDTNRLVGYHALKNRGLDASRPRAELDQALTSTVRDFLELWARELARGGVSSSKIYCHLAVADKAVQPAGETFLQASGYAPPGLAFDKLYRAGFSTYPSETTLDQLHAEVQKQGNPPWISAEGTNVVPNGIKGEPTMETYLGKMFNHGAVITNIFSWGIGGESERDRNLFRRATENDEALAAYAKFLNGKALVEQQRSPNSLSVTRLRGKIEKIQKELPSWVARTGRPDLAQSHMQKLDRFIKAGRLEDADSAANEILELMHQ